jgi:hypothetical protein
MGYFLAINSTGGELLNLLRSRFLDHYFPTQRKSTPVLHSQSFPSGADRVTGWYWFSENDRSTIDKVRSLLDGYVHVSANNDGTLTIDSQVYKEIEPLLFQRLEGSEYRYVTFREDEEGRITYMLTPEYPYERVAWYKSQHFHLGLFLSNVIVFLSACIVWPISFVMCRLKGKAADIRGSGGIARLWAGLICMSNLVALLVVALVLARVSLPSVELEFQTGIPSNLVVVLAFVVLLAIFAVGIPVFAVLCWKNKYWSIVGRLHYSLVALASLTHIWLLDYWNLLGLRF